MAEKLKKASAEDLRKLQEQLEKDQEVLGNTTPTSPEVLAEETKEQMMDRLLAEGVIHAEASSKVREHFSTRHNDGEVDAGSNTPLGVGENEKEDPAEKYRRRGWSNEEIEAVLIGQSTKEAEKEAETKKIIPPALVIEEVQGKLPPILAKIEVDVTAILLQVAALQKSGEEVPQSWVSEWLPFFERIGSQVSAASAVLTSRKTKSQVRIQAARATEYYKGFIASLNSYKGTADEIIEDSELEEKVVESIKDLPSGGDGFEPLPNLVLQQAAAVASAVTKTAATSSPQTAGNGSANTTWSKNGSTTDLWKGIFREWTGEFLAEVKSIVPDYTDGGGLYSKLPKSANSKEMTGKMLVEAVTHRFPAVYNPDNLKGSHYLAAYARSRGWKQV